MGTQQDVDRWGCWGRVAKPTYTVQDGFAIDGTLIRVEQPNVFFKEGLGTPCVYTKEAPDDPKCAGCINQDAPAHKAYSCLRCCDTGVITDPNAPVNARLLRMLPCPDCATSSSEPLERPQPERYLCPLCMDTGKLPFSLFCPACGKSPEIKKSPFSQP